MNFASRALHFLNDVGTVKTCIFFYLLWTPAQFEHDMIAFVGPYSWLAMQFSVEGHITCWIVWWIFGGLPKMSSVFRQCFQHMYLFLDNDCSFCNCNRTSFHELLRHKLNHESWGWVTVEMVMMSAACGGGEMVDLHPSCSLSLLLQSQPVWHVSASHLAKPAEEGKDQYRY